MTTTLITGGARSGKSRLALELAAPHDRRAFVATAEALDDEMRDRISRHRRERGDGFTTIEAPLDLAGALRALPPDTGVAVVDCLTVWLGNRLHHRALADLDDPAVTGLLDVLVTPPCDLVLVTNEVGTGIVPETPLGRRFRDLAGELNQHVAARADRVLLAVCGQPMWIKGVAI